MRALHAESPYRHCLGCRPGRCYCRPGRCCNRRGRCGCPRGRHGRRARNRRRRHPTRIPRAAGFGRQHPTPRHSGNCPDPASTARASLSYSRVLAGRGARSGRFRGAVRQKATLPGGTYYPGTYCVTRTHSRPHTADSADALTCLITRFYSLALARRLRRGVGSPVPSTYEDAR